MNMSINLTLVVQIVHFALASILISRIFLRPGYQAVKSDMDRSRQLKSSIVALQELIAHKQLYKRTRWELFQDYFAKQRPPLVDEIRGLHPYEKKVDVPRLTKKDLDRLSTEITQALKQKVVT